MVSGVYFPDVTTLQPRAFLALPFLYSFNAWIGDFQTLNKSAELENVKNYFSGAEPFRVSSVEEM